MIFVGVDWAEAHHDVFVEDEDGGRLAGGRLPEGVEGIARFHDMVGIHAEEPGEVVIGIETDRGLFVGALVATGYQVFAVNPMSTSRYRDRHSTSGAKSDPGDAKVLADMVRTDRHNHRSVAGDSELAEAIKVLARAHQTMIWARSRQSNFLRSTLREFYPVALVAFEDLTSADALEVLKVAPTPTLGAGLSRSKIAAALRRGGRRRRVDERAVEIQQALRAPQLQGSALVATAMGSSVSAAVAVIATMNAQVAELTQKLDTHFEQHPDAEVVRSLPGLGTILSARVLGEFGDEPNRYANAKCRKTTPAHRPSPGPPAPGGSCLLVTSETSAWLMPSTSGPLHRSRPHQGPEPSTTIGGTWATPTTPPSATSATVSSESSTAVSPVALPTTRPRHGRTGRRSNKCERLDS